MPKTEGVTATKPYYQMTPAERLADRIAKNREIDQRVVTHQAATNKRPAEIASRTTAVRGVLDKFQQIKATQGIDAASEYVRSRIQK
ncbi:MAG TPA: hypothetical protein VG273_04100 [Bryobacteraceae bacterium]|jgi:hypothetical protein|nr:hypothetical protein [Bryobacteraceae bacterium]